MYLQLLPRPFCGLSCIEIYLKKAMQKVTRLVMPFKDFLGIFAILTPIWKYFFRNFF